VQNLGWIYYFCPASGVAIMEFVYNISIYDIVWLSKQKGLQL